MQTFIKLSRVCLLGLIIVGTSLLAFWIVSGLQDITSPVLTKEQATYVAWNYLAENDVILDPSTGYADFYRGSWHVMFIVDPSSRPGAILVQVNPVTGKAKGVPLK